ncbi:non-functional pseudokinase ZED1-like [Humulus lupulus]|uniref:non-functional pseudokinase ZED1-like n=1 Tax=Humulus lupulus TaxID=3486 RepID=UPI002B4071BF|nr:non-functional pseudokinase ZED1-like [Humulus lupulus]XP_062083845.1 non-functional pseudokinase ZED1-like [Humulus lupulus]XP_062083846.1 non-functional pseudokinase ZED1-like [Humulus lupulus]XP_062083847.1 non-functional pseudokinase ZED1-like [Humulus lupulus]
MGGSRGPSKKERKRHILEHGGKLLEERIICCKDKCRCNPIRNFPAEQLLTATNNFQSCSVGSDRFFEWYKCSIDDLPVLIKKYNASEPKIFNHVLKNAYRDIAISSQMSSHRNALKLLGCCLEFSAPALVYEHAEYGPLNYVGGIDGDHSPLSWKMRLKVAIGTGNAIAYLHNAFSRPIVNRDIIPSHIFLDKDYVSKFSEFGFSIIIPEGETHVEDEIVGTLGFLDPNYFQTSRVTEHSDVYSFGVLLLVLVTGKNSYEMMEHEEKLGTITKYVIDLAEEEQFREIVDSEILGGGGIYEEKEEEFKAFIKLALSCTNLGERPSMIEVVKELIKIERLSPS